MNHNGETQALPKIYTLGELLVEIMRPRPGLSLGTAEEFRGPFPSGAPAIFISTAARLGGPLACRTAIIGAVSRDKFGESLLCRLEGDGVDCRLVRQSPRPGAVAFVAYDENGGREFIYHINGTAADDLLPDFASALEAQLAESRAKQRADRSRTAFHVMGCSLMAGKTMHRAINRAVELFSDCEISFDPNLRPELLGGRRFGDIADFVMQRCSILLPGEAELLLAADMPARGQLEAAVEKLYRLYPRLRLIHLKRGERGSCIYTRQGNRIGQSITVPPYPIDQVMPVIDPTGAGDCFDAAFLSAVLHGLPLEQAGFLASKAGAINVTALGPMEGDMSLLYRKLLGEDSVLDEILEPESK